MTKALFLLYGLALALVTAVPAIDLQTSALFHDQAGAGFWLGSHWLTLGIHEAVQRLPLVLALGFIAMVVAWPGRRKLGLFLLLAGIAGPILTANTLLKDHWGRARPREVAEFGGSATFTRAWQMTDQCERNCSFVSGDASLGFFLHTPFYGVPARLRRRVFIAGFVGGGTALGGLRILMGAHFLSDVLWAGALMLLTSALVHAAMYGPAQTRAAWREAFGTRSRAGFPQQS
jgi:lipid A 4'-phosphatase